MDEKIHLTLFELLLDDDKKDYQAGDEIPGVIKIRMMGRLPLSSLKICLSCVAEVKWVENPGTRYHRGGYVYQEKRKILDYTYAIPGIYGDNSLEPGEHEIPFKFKLPLKLPSASYFQNRCIPSSFKSSHGSVTYYVEGVINEPAIDEVHRVGTEIAVDAPIREDINLSIGNSVEKDFGILSLGSGKLSLHASLSKKGFFPGEVIEMHTTVENFSSSDATPRATLYQRQIYMCGERHKAFDDALTDAIVGKTVVENSESTGTLFIPIPEYISLTIKSGMVNIKYFVHVTLDIPHAFDIHMNIPIIITTKSALEDN